MVGKLANGGGFRTFGGGLLQSSQADQVHCPAPQVKHIKSSSPAGRRGNAVSAR